MSFLVRLRPTGPWRIGPPDGKSDQVDLLYRSDALYSAVTGAMRSLGMLEEWLGATAANPEGSAVRFSSCFPFLDQTDLVTPPRTLWPPAPSAKIRWKGARFVPLAVVQALLSGETLDEEAWSLDGPSECLVPAGKSGPFRVSLRKSAAVDRLTGQAHGHSTACLEFNSGAGLWCLVSAEPRWLEPLHAAFKLLADSGFGGERSRGWGRARIPEFGGMPALFDQPAEATGYWLLSLFSPAAADRIEWDRGNYTMLTRGGWVDSPVSSGEGKKLVNMIEEGSVISSGTTPVGAAVNVAPDGFAHPVYRSGFAFAVPLPAVTSA